MENISHLDWVCKSEEHLYEIIGINKKDIQDRVLGANDGKDR